MENVTHQSENASRFSQFYNKYETELMIAFFIGGFLFDLIMIDDFNNWMFNLQQVLYLVIIGTILYYDVLSSFQKVQIPKKLSKVWEYRHLVMNFLFGTLLNMYSIFYFKSSSLLSSFVFIIFMSAVLLAKEFSPALHSVHWFKFGMYILCLNAYFSMLYPTLLGFVGWTPFTLAVISTVIWAYFLFKKILPQNIDREFIKKHLLLPMLAVQLGYVVLYVVGWIPPVPLSAKFMGIYHKVEKENGKYLLSHEKPFWKFWANGDQTFHAQFGDNIYFFTNIYSPAKFSDQVNVRWMHDEKLNGWTTWDLIPMNISGGREEGFRGFTYKSKYLPGDWRVQIETTDGHEIGRIYFSVDIDNSSEPREFKVDEK